MKFSVLLLSLYVAITMAAPHGELGKSGTALLSDYLANRYLCAIVLKALCTSCGGYNCCGTAPHCGGKNNDVCYPH
jgi:hypothetical protein